MTLADLLIVGALVVFLVALLHANNTLGRNPYLQIKSHEDLVGPLPESMSFSEKLQLIRSRGISSGKTVPILGLVFALIALLAFLQWPSATFEKDLILRFDNNKVVPSSAMTTSGAPFSGTAYGTFFGDRYGCTEWSGPFENGAPHGVFSIYENCNMGELRVSYEHGSAVP
jgi:hypothetical protein